MLGTIAKKLRILGFDSRYSAAIDDEDLMLVAKKESRIIITKDHQLADNAKKHDILTIEVSTRTEKEQMVEIAEKMSWEKFEFNVHNTRCPVCNGDLQIIEKDQVTDRVPSKVIQNVEEFWSCSDCQHIYWEGTHIRNLKKLIDEINGQL